MWRYHGSPWVCLLLLALSLSLFPLQHLEANFPTKQSAPLSAALQQVGGMIN